MTIVETVVDALARAGAAHLFAVDPPAPLLTAAAARGIDVVQGADVTAACIMAAATGDLTGSPGAVVLAGPASAARPALELALVERSPLVGLGPPANEALAGAAKAVIDVTPASAAHWIAHAVHRALAWPRGPVYLGVADPWTTAAAPVASSASPAALASSARELDRAAAIIRKATRPVVLAGTGARDASARSWVRAFAEAVPAPVVTTWKAKGTLPDPHPLVFGVATISEPAAELLGRADVVIALGVDDAERDELTLPSRVVWLGPGAADVAGEVGAILGDLAPKLGGTRADWDVAELDRGKRRLDVQGTDRSVRLVARAREAMPAGTIAAFDATLREAAARWDCVTPDELLVPARSTLAGFGLPAALAAAVATPSAAVLCFIESAASATARAALAIAARRGVALGVVVTGSTPPPACAGVPGMPVPDDTALAIALGRWLAERRLLLLDATRIMTP